MNEAPPSDVVELLFLQEDALALMYSQFASSLPEMSVFWKNLVVQEKAHGHVLRSLVDLCRTKDVVLNTSKFNAAAIRTNIDNMRKQTERSAKEGTTPIRALAIASDIEHSLIEKGFFSIIESDLASVRSEIEAIEKHTRQHISMVDDKLRELREEQQQGEHTDIQVKVVEAQRKIIDDLARCEEAICRLYALYSEKLPDLADFWSDLSEKESVHAKLLRSMHKQIDKGEIFHNIGRFDQRSISSFLAKLDEAADFANTQPITPMESIETALAIESSVLDAHFYDIVKSDAKEYKILAGRLSEDTHAHVKSVQTKMRELQAQLPREAPGKADDGEATQK